MGHLTGNSTIALGLAASLVLCDGSALSQTAKPADTEVNAPVPPVVTPGARDSDPPSDAVVLFSGRDLS